MSYTHTWSHILSPHAKYRVLISFDLRPRGVFSAATHTHTNFSLPGTAELKGRGIHKSEKWADAAVTAAEEAQVAWLFQWALTVAETGGKRKGRQEG